jgi:hypothetical protein
MTRRELIVKLEEAHSLASEFRGGYSGEVLSAEEFSISLGKAVEAFGRGDNSTAKDLWLWFAPTTQWDDFIGRDGIELGNQIFEALDRSRAEYEIEILHSEGGKASLATSLVPPRGGTR